MITNDLQYRSTKAHLYEPVGLLGDTAQSARAPVASRVEKSTCQRPS